MIQQQVTTRFSLQGMWRRTINDRGIDTVPVPGCYRPLGACTLEFDFWHPWPDAGGTERIFLVSEGVMASAAFTLNGQPLGVAGPWATYRFELPTGLLRGENSISAHVRDISESFGTTPGRRFDAGLIRELYLERRPAAFISAVSFQPRLNEACNSAECTVLVEIDGQTAEMVQLTLAERRSGRVAAAATAPAGHPLTFTVDWPQLWSPQMPQLYTLTVRLGADEVRETVGFRRLEVRGQDFYLNNERLLLKGVCRHEFTSRHGYCPTPEETRRELALIKHSGFNYIRLVHSPQAPIVPRLAGSWACWSPRSRAPAGITWTTRKWPPPRWRRCAAPCCAIATCLPSWPSTCITNARPASPMRDKLPCSAASWRPAACSPSPIPRATMRWCAR